MNRILLIEDDSGAQLLYRSRLADLGYQVVVASTGAMGLMEARSAPFDLFLVDIGLGSGIDGFEVCRRLKTIPEIHGVPVVLISGHVKAQEDLHRGYEAGCQSFLVKGDLTLLEDVVRAMLRIKSLQDDLAMQNRQLEERNRRVEAETARSADLEHALSYSVGRATREWNRPDGMLLVDGEGVVRSSDRGARELFGQVLDGKHLALLAPHSRLEAIARNARTEPNESIRFETPDRAGRAARPFLASVFPFVPRLDRSEPSLCLVLFFDPTRPRRAGTNEGEEESALMRRAWAPLVEAARDVFRPAALLGTSAGVCALRANVARAARGDGPVLVRGPSGAGKGLVARILHFSSGRTGPFLTLSCAPTGAGELGSELFGRAKDEGPDSRERLGAIQQARGGTLFLQDIERLALPLQERLLQVLKHGRVPKMGSATPERVHVRLVAGTTFDLGRAVAQGHFLGELAERLMGETLAVPSLRERSEDLERLIQHFAAHHGRFEDTRFSPEAMDVLVRHAWSDDVRELERAVQEACGSAQGTEIQRHELPLALVDTQGPAPAERSPAKRTKGRAGHLDRELGELLTSLDSTVSLLDSYEKGALLHALRLTQGDKLAAARLLKVGKSTFYRKLKQYGIA